MRKFPLLGLGLAFAITGCGGSDAPPAVGAPSSAAGPSPSPTVSPTPTPAPSPSATRKPGFPTAADGRNVRACRDGNCEILVTKRTKIPLDARFGMKTFSFDPADSTWRSTYPEGGTGSVRFLEPPYTGTWAAPSGTESLTLTVVASAPGKAVISLRPVG